VHTETGWFSLELTRYLSQCLGVPFAGFYGVISFYALFKTEPAVLCCASATLCGSNQRGVIHEQFFRAVVPP
jgi:NADH:ubiquinone oxidoreductase subunit E